MSDDITTWDTMHIPDPATALEMLDDRLNTIGREPQVCGYDSDGVPVLLWLNEEGGDSVYLVVADLRGGDSAEYSEVRDDVDPQLVKWPVSAFFPAGPRHHMEVIEIR